MGLFKRLLRRSLGWLLRRHPEIAFQALKQWPPTASFASLPDYPQRDFEDLVWMLASNPTNKNLLLLELDEAAFLFRLARSRPAVQILEIGRCFGGSTFLFAVASDRNSTVTSIDIAPQNDDLLRTALAKIGLLHKVRLIVGNSQASQVIRDSYDLIFVDGDHSYEGVEADYGTWKRAVKPGGNLIFHNAAIGRAGAGVTAGPMRLAGEITQRDNDHYTRQPDVGSLAIFLRTQKPW